MFVEIFSRARKILEDDPFSNIHFQHAHAETIAQAETERLEINQNDVTQEILSAEQAFCSLFGYSGKSFSYGEFFYNMYIIRQFYILQI